MEPESGSVQPAMGACTLPGTLHAETVRISNVEESAGLYAIPEFPSGAHS